MFDRISRTWHLMGASWGILKQDRILLLFPALSGLCCLLVMASFALPMFLHGGWQPPARNADALHQIIYYGTLFLFYFCNYFVITFFNAGIVSCAIRRLRGETPTFSDGLRDAAARIHLIIGWALLAASVGLILRIIEDRSEKIGAIVAGLLGMAFSVVSFLVVPVLVVENKGPLAALKSSTALLKKTWGDQLVGNFSFGSIFGLLALPAIILIIAGVGLGVGGNMDARAMTLMVTCIALAVIYLVILSLVQSTLQTIFQAALYLYAQDGYVSPEFDRATLRSVMIKK